MSSNSALKRQKSLNIPPEFSDMFDSSFWNEEKAATTLSRNRNRVSFAHSPTRFIYDNDDSSEELHEDDYVEEDSDFESFETEQAPSGQLSYAEEELVKNLPRRSSSISQDPHHYTAYHHVPFETDFRYEAKVNAAPKSPVSPTSPKSPSKKRSRDISAFKYVVPAAVAIPIETDSPRGSITTQVESMLQKFAAEPLEIDTAFTAPIIEPLVTASTSTTSHPSPGITVRKITNAPWEEESQTTESSIRPSSHGAQPPGSIDTHEPQTDAATINSSVPPSAFMTTAALSRMARDKGFVSSVGSESTHRSYLYQRPLSTAEILAAKRISTTVPRESPFRDSSGQSINFMGTIKGPSRRRIICISTFVTVGLILAGLGVVIALMRIGIIHVDWFSMDGTTPDKPVTAPSKELIIDPQTPPGLAGCSNVPVRAARRSWELQTRGPKSDLDRCSTGSVRYSLTECDLLTLMTPTSNSTVPPDTYLNNYVRTYLPPLLDAAETYDLNCAKNRLAAFLAQVKHETNGLTTMRQQLDGGAGAIHLLPMHFSRAITRIAAAKQIYENTEKDNFASKYSLDQLATLGNGYAKNQLKPEEKAFVEFVGSSLISRPEVTFLTAGWWFEEGSKDILSSMGCGDLRKAADIGKGAPSNDAAGTTTGFYEVSKCIFGSLTDPGISQRVGYYDDIMSKQKWQCQTKDCPAE